ncbi:hypothetical protein ACWD48_06165 [Streptomyces sp. NPDC002519]
MENETKACSGWGEECGNSIPKASDLCPDCTTGRLDAQSPLPSR